MKILLALFLSVSLLACSFMDVKNPPETVKALDLERYTGKWYEIARYPARFQDGCYDSAAEYKKLDGGYIEVVNSCSSKDSYKKAVGKAWFPDPADTAKLKVQFFGPFTGDYWIVDLGENYEYSVVSEPRRKYLWILSREPDLPEAKLASILEKLKAKGFDTEKLLFNHKIRPTQIKI